jgi:GTPase SAR1 family protein
VVGNKLDLEADRNVKTEKAEAQTKDQRINYYEVSAKTGQNLNEMFKGLCSILLNALVDKIIDKGDNKPQPRSIQELKTGKSIGNNSQVIPFNPKVLNA